MPLTHNFKDIVKKRAERDPEFRIALLCETIESLLSDDLATAKILLRDYVNATGGINHLANELNKKPQSLRGMLSEKGNPYAKNLLRMVGHLKKREGVELKLTLTRPEAPSESNEQILQYS